MKSLLSLALIAGIGITGWSCQEAASQQTIGQHYFGGNGDPEMDSVGAVSWLARSSNIYTFLLPILLNFMFTSP